MLPLTAFADIQTTSDISVTQTNSSPTQPSGAYQAGTGFSGTFTGGLIYATTGTLANNDASIILTYEAFSDNTYTTSVGTCAYLTTYSFTPDTSDYFPVNSFSGATGTGCTASSTAYYTIKIAVSNPSGHAYDMSLRGSNTLPPSVIIIEPNDFNDTYSLALPYAKFYGISGGYFPDANTTTRIDSITPLDNTSYATSTTFGFNVTGYISAADYVAGSTNITIKYSNGGFESSLAVGPAFASIQQADNSATFVFPVTTSGHFSFSTTTNMQQIGDYSLNTSLTVPRYSFLGFTFYTTTLVASSTVFQVATSTAFGTLRQSVQADYRAFVSNASSTINTSVCSPISGNFSVVPCMSILFGFPSLSQLQADFALLDNQVLTHQPWAYPTRFFTILTTSSTSTLPSFTVNIAIASGTETTLSYNPSDMLAGGATLLSGIEDPHSGKNLEEIIKPFIQLFVAISVLIIIIFDIMAMGHHTKSGGKNYT